MTTLCFIGAGNMARSLIGGLLAQPGPTPTIRATDVSPEALAAVAALGPVATDTDNLAAIDGADAVVLAVKPQVMAQVLEPMRARIESAQPLMISIAAGIELDALAHWGGAAPWVRCMPNTPALIGKGITALVATAAVDAPARDLATRLLTAVGQVIWLEDEAGLDAVTALSGSGPAYVFRFIEALVDAGVALGLPSAQATQLALATVEGAALMASGSPESPATLRERVTSPGGTTAAALAELQAGGFGALVRRALAAAAARSRTLAAELGPTD